MLLQEIYEIVENMDKREKSSFMRYSKLYSERANERHYLHLYQEITHQVQEGKLDQGTLLKRLKRKLDLKNLDNYKQYLHQQLLQFLVMYHRKFNSTTQITNTIQIALMLEQKGLECMNQRFLEKAKKQSKDAENFEPGLFAVKLQMKIVKEEETPIKQLLGELHVISNQYEQVKYLYKYYMTSFFLAVEANILREDDPRLEEFQEVLLVLENMKLLSNTARLYKFMIRLNLAKIVCVASLVLEISLEMIEQIDSGVLPYPDKRTIAYSNIMDAACRLKQFETYLNYEGKLKETVKKNTTEYALLLEKQMIYHRTRQLKKEGLLLVEEIEALFFDRENDLEKSTAIYQQRLTTEVINFLVVIEAYERAIIWINRWFQLDFNKKYYQGSITVKLLEVIVHLELENLLLLPSLINAFLREVKKHMEIRAFEKLLFSFLRQSLAALNLEKDPNTVMREIYQNYQARTIADQHPFWPHSFDFDHYFKKRLENLTT